MFWRKSNKEKLDIESCLISNDGRLANLEIAVRDLIESINGIKEVLKSFSTSNSGFTPVAQALFNTDASSAFIRFDEYKTIQGSLEAKKKEAEDLINTIDWKLEQLRKLKEGRDTEYSSIFKSLVDVPEPTPVVKSSDSDQVSNKKKVIKLDEVPANLKDKIYRAALGERRVYRKRVPGGKVFLCKLVKRDGSELHLQVQQYLKNRIDDTVRFEHPDGGVMRFWMSTGVSRDGGCPYHIPKEELERLREFAETLQVRIGQAWSYDNKWRKAVYGEKRHYNIYRGKESVKVQGVRPDSYGLDLWNDLKEDEKFKEPKQTKYGPSATNL